MHGKYRRLRVAEAAAVSAAGVILFAETAIAVRANMLWLDRAVVMDARFHLYLWGAVSMATLLVVKGIINGLRQTDESPGELLVENPLAITVAALLIVVARGWRIHTDVAPLNRVEPTDAMPLVVQLFANPFWSYTVVALSTTALVLVFRRALRLSGSALKV
jgi:hypothetical protein